MTKLRVASRNFANAPKILRSAHVVYLYFFNGSQNEQRLILCTALLTDFHKRDGVLTARYEVSLSYKGSKNLRSHVNTQTSKSTSIPQALGNFAARI